MYDQRTRRTALLGRPIYRLLLSLTALALSDLREAVSRRASAERMKETSGFGLVYGYNICDPHRLFSTRHGRPGGGARAFYLIVIGLLAYR